MKKLITKLALASALFTGAFSTTSFVNANADQASVNTSDKQFDHQVDQYMNLLKQSSKTDLIKSLLKDGRPSSLSDLGSDISLHSDNQAATNSQDAKNNAAFYLRVHRIFKQQINKSYQCDDGNKLSTNLKELKHTNKFDSHSDIEKVSMTGMGLGDSMDFGNRPNK